MKYTYIVGFLALAALSGCEKPACDATTCSTGCCDAEGTCRPGTDVDACGVGGRVCLACSGSQMCGVGVCSSSGGGTGGGSGNTGGGTGTIDYVVTVNEVALSDGDFFELINTGTTTADLSGFQVADLDGATNGPKFADALTLPAGTTLAPGAILLFTEGTTAGPSTSCGSAQVTSCFHITFGLSAGNGDSIFLVDASGNTVLRVDAPADAHPPAASYGRLPDGTGSFRTTSRTPGLPNAEFMPVDAGTFDAGIVTDGGAAAVVFNEVAVSNGDFFELYNSGNEPVDLSGYKLADLDSVSGGPKLSEAVTVPSGTTLAPGEFLLFYEGANCGDAGVSCINFPYGLSSGGESLFLLNTTDGLEQRLDIPAAPHAANRSYGRIPDGSGSFVQTLRTPGVSNLEESNTDAGVVTDAGIGEVVFNEVAVSNGDFYELINAGSSSVDLSGFKVADLDSASNGPKVADAVTIPAGTVIASGARLLFYEGATCGTFTGSCINFTYGLGGSGESLFILSPNDDVLLRLDIPAGSHSANRSWGRIPEATGAFVENARTPGEANALFVTPDAGMPVDAGIELEFVVVRVGPGQAADAGLTNAATPVALEYRSLNSGAVQRTVALPTTTVGSQRALLVSGSALSEGQLARGTNGWALAGYNADAGVTSVNGVSGLERVGAWIGDDGGVNTTTAFTNGYANNNVRAAASVDGKGFWFGGTANSNGGVRYAGVGSPTSVDVYSGVTNVRAVKIFQGQLYAATAANNPVTTSFVYSVGTGLPQATTTAAELPGITSATSDFTLLDLAPPVGPDRVYVVAGSNVQSFNFGTTWSAGVTFTPPSPAACTSVAAKATSLGVVVLCSTGGAVYRWLDDGLSTPVAQLVVSVEPGFVFRGVGFE